MGDAEVADRPKKPRADLPVFLHRSGQYSWKCKGKFWYLGTDPDAAVAEYERTHAWIRAGKEPPAADATSPEALTLLGLWDQFLAAKAALRDQNVITAPTYGKYLKLSKTMLGVLSPSKRVVDLLPSDFLMVRGAFSSRLGPTALGSAIVGIRTLFNWGVESNLLEKLPRFGADFKPPGVRVRRAHKHEKILLNGPRMFSTEEVKALLARGKLQWRAMILLALNAAYEPHDLRRLEWRQFDFDQYPVWLSFPRPKTGIDRRCPLWPATVNAIQALRELPQRWPLQQSLLFVTRLGTNYGDEAGRAVISAEFKHLAEAAGVYRRGVGMLGMRHTFATIAAEGGDQRAVDYVMGHAVHTMGETYRESISDARLIAVCDRVHCWLFGSGVPGWQELGKERLRIVAG